MFHKKHCFVDEEEVEDDTEVVDITVGEFKEIIRDLFNTLQSGGKAMDDMQDTADAEMQAGPYWS